MSSFEKKSVLFAMGGALAPLPPSSYAPVIITTDITNGMMN